MDNASEYKFLDEGVRRFRVAQQTIDSFHSQVQAQLWRILSLKEVRGPYVPASADSIKCEYRTDDTYLWFHAKFTTSGAFNKMKGTLYIDISWQYTSEEILCGCYFQPDDEKKDKPIILQKLASTTLRSPFKHISGFCGIQAPYSSFEELPKRYIELSRYMFEILK